MSFQHSQGPGHCPVAWQGEVGGWVPVTGTEQPGVGESWARELSLRGEGSCREALDLGLRQETPGRPAGGTYWKV